MQFSQLHALSNSVTTCYCIPFTKLYPTRDHTKTNELHEIPYKMNTSTGNNVGFFPLQSVSMYVQVEDAYSNMGFIEKSTE